MKTASSASRPWILAAGLAVLAAAASLLRFTPAFVLWRGLKVPAVASDPALNRAGEALLQLGHPLAYHASANNRVIDWRLLFPILGHALAMPPRLYLALPHLGCLLVLLFIARLLLRHGFSAPQAFAATVAAATCSWFFVSTAWLAYFDSWYVLCLLLTVFAPRAALLAAVLAGPWIDERFVLTLPLGLLLRDRYFDAAGPRRSGRECGREALACAAALLPWLIIRLGAYALHRDAVTADYLQAMTPRANGPFYAIGLWEGLRWAWLPVLAWLAVEARAKQPKSLLLAAALFLTLAVNLFAANDLSRSVSIVLPAVVLGVLLLRELRPRQVSVLLFAVGGMNLLFPAEHVVSTWTEPISALPTELEHARNPPPPLDPDYYTRAATTLNGQGDPQGALAQLETAFALDRDNAAAYATRSVSLYKLGRLPEALADANRAVQLQPRLPEALYNRGMLRAARGDLPGAEEDVAAALREAPPDWAARPQAEASEQSIRRNITGR